ncbi:MAG TPA: 16S rRNA (guanine(527)-N(7))-methyltransferase RsmG [Parvibaculum sp.]|jgi:16S rRNA (guanine527-N7)-methyltransferase
MQVIDAESFLAATSVSRETMDRLRVYETLLLKWQKSINLVSAGTLADLWARHMWDSAQLAALAPRDAVRWMDVGSGAGFPGLVVATLLRDRPGFQMELVESDQRKSVFLKEASRLMELSVRVHTGRIEDFSRGEGELPPDIISARALASLSQILSWTSPFWGKATIGLFPKGRNATDELTESRKNWIFEAEAIASLSDPSGTVLKLWGLKDANLGRDR